LLPKRPVPEAGAGAAPKMPPVLAAPKPPKAGLLAGFAPKAAPKPPPKAPLAAGVLAAPKRG